MYGILKRKVQIVADESRRLEELNDQSRIV